MSYPTQYRKRIIEYRIEGHMLEKTSETFKVSIPTIRKWEKQYKETGDLNQKSLNRSHKKLANEHPDAYQAEMAGAFGYNVPYHVQAPLAYTGGVFDCNVV